MKTNIDNMTHWEKIALAREDVDRLVKYAMAEEGVKFLPAPIDPPKFTPNFDVTVYEVRGFFFYGKAKADEFAAWYNANTQEFCKLDYDWQKGSSYRYVNAVTETNEATVNATLCYSPARYAGLSGELKSHNDAMEAYRKEKSEFDSENMKKRKIEEYIYGEWHEAMKRQRELERKKSQYAEYLELAQNNVEQAQAFFKKAYFGLNEDQYREIFE